jgi:hypothetical protein
VSILKMNRSRRVFPPALAACVLLFASFGAAAQKEKSAGNVLAKGNLYYSSDDITDRAAKEYKDVRGRYKGTREAETAQYFLASYYHRKFYIVREKQREDDEDAIHEAQEEYEDYIKKFAPYSQSPEWLADSHFNLALIWFEYGHRGTAVDYLNKLQHAAGKDPKVYIYDVLWSPRSSDRVEGHYDSAELAAFTREQIQNNRTVGEVVDGLRRWCRERQGR